MDPLRTKWPYLGKKIAFRTLEEWPLYVWIGFLGR